MATNGSFDGNISGSKPYLQLLWDVNDTDVTNNRTRIRLRLYLKAPYRLDFSSPKSGAIEGYTFSHTSGFSGTGTKLLRTQYIWISHNSSGVGSKNVSAYFNINITYSGSWTGKLTVSGTVNPPDIKRLSNFTSARTTEPMKEAGGGRLELTVTDRPAGYYQWVGIYDGDTIVHDWGYNQATPTWWPITSEIAKKILDRMPNDDSKRFSVRVYTYTGNGTGYLGYQTQTLGVTIDDSEVPTKTSFSQTQAGSGWDNSNDMYIQNHSKLLTSFSSKAPYGTTIVSEKVTINGQDYSGNGPITSETIKDSGWVPVVYNARDARGRTYYDGERIWVEAYSAPTIATFTAERDSASQSNVDIYRSGSWDNLDGNNNLNIKIRRSLSTSSTWYEVENTNAYDGSFGSSVSDAGRSISSAYDYELIITDDLGNTAERAVGVSTAKVLMNFNEDIGVGIGKMHQRGTLDVMGDMYLDGTIQNGITVNNDILPLHSGYEDIGSSSKEFRNIYAEDVRINGYSIIDSGSNSNGDWVKFADGTMIAWYGSTTKRRDITTGWGELYYSSTEYWTYPISFKESPRVFAEYNGYSGDAWVIPSTGKSRTRSQDFYLLRPSSYTVNGNIDYMAIGRWK